MKLLQFPKPHRENIPTSDPVGFNDPDLFVPELELCLRDAANFMGAKRAELIRLSESLGELQRCLLDAADQVSKEK